MRTRGVVLLGVLLTFLNVIGFALHARAQRDAAYRALLAYGQERLARACRGAPLAVAPFFDTVDGWAVEVVEDAWRFFPLPEQGRRRERLVEIVVRVRTVARPLVEAEVVGLTTTGVVGRQGDEPPARGAFPSPRLPSLPPRR